MTTIRAGDGLRKARTALLSGLMIAVFSLSMTPTASAGSCSDDNHGGGHEPVSCGFGCDSGDRVHTWIQASNQGDTVWAEASCGGAEAFCGGTGGCNQWSATSGTGNLDGTCKGAADVGFYGKVELKCKTGNGGGGGSLPGIGNLLPGDGGCTGNFIHMVWDAGVLTTTIGSGGECKTFERVEPADDNGVVLLSL